jgi:hypothetical protein
MKFRFLVSGGALSDGQIEALRHSIEDLCQHYGMDRLSEPFLVQRLSEAWPLEGASARSERCRRCGGVVLFKRSKPERDRLTRFFAFVNARPLHLVVWWLVCVGVGFFGVKLLIRWLS